MRTQLIEINNKYIDTAMLNQEIAKNGQPDVKLRFEFGVDCKVAVRFAGLVEHVEFCGGIGVNYTEADFKGYDLSGCSFGLNDLSRNKSLKQSICSSSLPVVSSSPATRRKPAWYTALMLMWQAQIDANRAPVVVETVPANSLTDQLKTALIVGRQRTLFG